MPILGSSAGATKGAPGAPTVGTATVTNGTTVSLAFTAPTFSKLPITSYTVTSSPSIALSVSGSSSPLTITGSFAQSTNYTFTIAAINANGTSAASAASNSIKPNPAVLYYTSSTTFTPSSYPFNYTAYVVGGGGGVFNGMAYLAGVNSDNRFVSGGGGGGYYATGTGTINSGNATVTIGTVGNNGSASGTTSNGGGSGGTSAFHNVSASGGVGASGADAAAQNGSNGGAGGSGGGGGGGLRISNNTYTAAAFRNGGNGGSGGSSGQTGTGSMPMGYAGNPGAGSGNASSPSGGPGSGSTSTANNSPGTFTAYNGISVAGSNYGSGRGNGSYITTQNGDGLVSGNAGFIVVVES